MPAEMNMPSGVQPVSTCFVIAAWWIKALSAHTVTLNKSQLNRLSYRETNNGGMKTVNPSGHKVMNYYCCKVANKEESLDQLLKQFFFFLLKAQTASLDASLQLKGLFVSFPCFTSVIQPQPFPKHWLALTKDNEENLMKFHCIRTM